MQTKLLKWSAFYTKGLVFPIYKTYFSRLESVFGLYRGVSTLSLQAKNSGFEVEKPLSFPASLP